MLIEKIRERMERIGQLTKAELDELRTDVVTCFDEHDKDDASADDVKILTELSAAGQKIMARDAEIKAGEEQSEADKEAARQAMRTLKGETEGDEGGEGDAGEGDGTETEGENADEGADESELVSVTAGGQTIRVTSSPSSIARKRGNGLSAIKPTTVERPRAQLVAAGGLRGISEGTAITDKWALAEATCKTLRSMNRRGASAGVKVIATANYAELYPENRRFSRDTSRNAQIVDDATSTRALVATGGICLPVNVDYDLDVWAAADRPLKMGLAAFDASRGGITYRQPSTLAAVASSAGVWTEATDADPGESTKNIFQISCESPVTVYTEAITSRLEIGNMQGQFDPETIAMYTELAVAYHARTAELQLLAAIAAAAVQNITSPTYLGMSRDWLTIITQVAANFRNTHRINNSVMLTVVIPEWVRSMFISDRINELAHDSAGSFDPFAIDDDYVDAMLAKRGIKAIWTLEGLPAETVTLAAGTTSTSETVTMASTAGVYVGQTVTGTGIPAGAKVTSVTTNTSITISIAATATGSPNLVFTTFPSQQFSGFTANTIAPAFPSVLTWHLFLEGSLQFLDGGELVLGVVRDSTLNQTNDYETFSETFEGLANRSFAGGVLQVNSTLAVNGTSSATTAY